MEAHLAAAEFAGEAGALGDDFLVGGPVLVGDDSAGFADGLKGAVVFADGADHRADNLPAAGGDIGFDGLPGGLVFGVAVSAIGVDEGAEREVDFLDREGLEGLVEFGDALP